MSPPLLLAAAIFAASLAVLLVRPRRVPDWAAALAGGGAMVAVSHTARFVVDHAPCPVLLIRGSI